VSHNATNELSHELEHGISAQQHMFVTAQGESILHNIHFLFPSFSQQLGSGAQKKISATAQNSKV